MSVFNPLFTAIHSTLAGNGSLTALLGGTFIYMGQAPDGQALPYVVFSSQSSFEENITPREMNETIIFARAYSDYYPTAGSIDAALKTALGGTIEVDGYTNFWLSREQGFSIPERGGDGKIIWQAGAFYKVRLCK